MKGSTMKTLLAFLIVAVMSTWARADVDLATALLHTCGEGAPQLPRIAAGIAVRDDAIKAQGKADASVKAADAERVKAPAVKREAATTKLDAAQRKLQEAKSAVAEAQQDLIDVPKQHDELCQSKRLVDYVGHYYPSGYLKAKLGVDACHLLTPQSGASTSELNDIAGVCTHATETGFNAAGIAISVVQGLGDLLELEAKQEVIQYLIEQIGLKFCNYSFALNFRLNGLANTPIKLDAWFPESCALIRADDPDTFTYGDLKKAFADDLHGIPTQLAALANAVFAMLSPGQQDWIAIAGILADVVFSMAEHKTPLEILQDLGAKSDRYTGAVVCDFTKPMTNGKECTALLLFQLARTSAADYKDAGGPSVTQVIMDTLNAFCEVHGPAKLPNGDCVISADHYDEWHNRLLEFYRAVRMLIDLHESSQRLKLTATDGEIATRSSGDLAKALKQLVVSFAAIVENLPELKSDTTIETELSFLEEGLDIYAAIVASDQVAFRQAVIALLKSKLLEHAISADAAHAVTVIVSLATAKDHAEAKDILQEAADPVGTYKAKFGADHLMISLNGNVGFMVAGERLFNTTASYFRS